MKTIKTFQFKSDIKFVADDLSHAFEKLQEHFKNLREHNESYLIEEGEMNLELYHTEVKFTKGNIKREKIIKLVKG